MISARGIMGRSMLRTRAAWPGGCAGARHRGRRQGDRFCEYGRSQALALGGRT